MPVTLSTRPLVIAAKATKGTTAVLTDLQPLLFAPQGLEHAGTSLESVVGGYEGVVLAHELSEVHMARIVGTVRGGNCQAPPIEMQG
jgi:hypothetical protein